MTIEERARKIWNEIPRDLGSERWIQYIAAQLREVEREARESKEFRGGYHLGDLQGAYRRGLSEGFNAAREKAAGIAEQSEVRGKYRKAIAERIWGMEP